MAKDNTVLSGFSAISVIATFVGICGATAISWKQGSPVAIAGCLSIMLLFNWLFGVCLAQVNERKRLTAIELQRACAMGIAQGTAVGSVIVVPFMPQELYVVVVLLWVFEMLMVAITLRTHTRLRQEASDTF